MNQEHFYCFFTLFLTQTHAARPSFVFCFSIYFTIAIYIYVLFFPLLYPSSSLYEYILKGKTKRKLNYKYRENSKKRN